MDDLLRAQFNARCAQLQRGQTMVNTPPSSISEIRSLVNAELRSQTFAKSFEQSFNSALGDVNSSLKQDYIVTKEQLTAGKMIYLESVIFLSKLAW
eukprot:sb/3479142/